MLVTAVGDISLGDHPVCVGTGVGSRLRRGGVSPGYPFEKLEGLFARSALVFGNLETVLSEEGLRSHSLRSLEMRGPSDGAARLAKAGVTVLNIANNHILQHGPLAFWQTIDALRAQGIAVVGLAERPGGPPLPAIIERDALSIAFLGYAFEPDKYHDGPPLYAFGPTCDIQHDIKRALDEAEIVVCSLHWGHEFMRYPTSTQVALAHHIADAGAHLVIGHHPHVFQGVETYNRTLIAYSLGNFVFDMVWAPALRSSLILDCVLDRSGVQSHSCRFAVIGGDFQPAEDAGAELMNEFRNLSDRVTAAVGEGAITASLRESRDGIDYRATASLSRGFTAARPTWRSRISGEPWLDASPPIDVGCCLSVDLFQTDHAA